MQYRYPTPVLVLGNSVPVLSTSQPKPESNFLGHALGFRYLTQIGVLCSSRVRELELGTDTALSWYRYAVLNSAEQRSGLAVLMLRTVMVILLKPKPTPAGFLCATAWRKTGLRVLEKLWKERRRFYIGDFPILAQE
uniref:Uncharacterized protein n=1 Tax=Ananas comosus var. bracteatus TaxID=296719 RepID=A0A6V7P4Q2_ANACO|nr:unnamed protein product [Ananas comosus var. bracteatus]